MGKRLLLIFMALLMLVPVPMGSPIALANVDDETVYDKPGDPKPPGSFEGEVVSIKRKAWNKKRTDGIIMNDVQRIPRSFGDGRTMADFPAVAAPGHTGWSVRGSVCERKITHYEPARNSHGEIIKDKDGNPIMLPRWGSTWHSGETYEGRLKGGYFYATNNKFDSGSLSGYIGQLKSKYSHLGITDWEGVRGTLTGTDHWKYYSFNTQTDNSGSCQTGDTSYYYIDNDILMEGEVELPLDDPSNTKPAPGRTDGDLKGKAYWELLRHDRNARSGVDAHASFSIAGDHYATRNVQHTLKIGNQSIKQPGPISTRILDGMSVKNGVMTYEFSYDYTNHYRDIYRCSDSQDGHCYAWVFVERIPDWNYKQTFAHSGAIRIDHRMEEVIAADKIEDVLGAYIIGRKDDVRSKANTVKTPYYEQFGKASGNDRKSMNALKTQTALPITPGKLSYRVTFPSGSHSGGNVLRNEKSYGFFFPADVDESLKERYANRTPYNEYKYAFPLQQSVQEGANSNQVWDYDTDLFFMARALGYISGTPYADMVKQQVMNGRTLPSYEQLMKDGTEKLEREFVQDMNYNFYDEVLYTSNQSEFEKLQRYQLPIAGDSTLHPNTVYKNHIVLRNMGLNDLTFRFNQSFSFEHYLFGSGADEAWIIEQPEGRPVKMNQRNEEDVHLIRIEPEDIMKLVEIQFNRPQQRMHGFRIIDRDIIEKTQAVIGDIGL